MTQNNWAVKSSYMTKGVSRHTLAPMHQLASDHYLAGRMNEAMDAYRQILQIDASDAIALHGMGLIDLTEGQTKSALDALEKAIALDLNNSEYHVTLGIARSMNNSLNLAKLSFQEAVRLKPSNLNARYNFALCLLNLGESKSAVGEFRRILKKQAGNTDALLHLGLAYLIEGAFSRAVQYFKRCLQLDPLNTKARINLGNAYQEDGLFTQAVSEYDAVLNTEPHNVEALYNLGLVLKNLREFDNAVARFREIIVYQPDHIGALNNLGTTLEGIVNKEEALLSLGKASDLAPENFVILFNLATRQKDFLEWESAEINYRKVLKMNEDFKPANTNLANLLRDTGRLDEAITIYRGLLSSASDLSNAHSDYLANLNYIYEGNNEFIYQESLEWERRHGDAKKEPYSVFRNEKVAERRLKIGYVSPDFHEHSINYFFSPLLSAHHQKNVETFCFSDNSYDDEATQHLVSAADHWRSIQGMSDMQASKLIRDDGIDVLVDLTGHMAKNRLTMFSLRPSPIQVTWLGYPNTTGLATMDYRLTDDISDPEGLSDIFHSEKIIRVPEGFLCYRPSDMAPEVVDPAHQGKGFVTFGSFNNLAKVTTVTIDTWAKCLIATPGSRLYVKALALSSPTTKERFYSRFEERGINRARIQLAPRVVTIEEHLSLYAGVDIALDTFPYNGTTTTFEALWMGVPVITLMGQRHAARVGSSILLRLGLDDLVAENYSDFVRRASNLASNKTKLLELRHNLRTILTKSNFLNYDQFASRMEKCYRDMWLTWCKSSG